MRRRTTRVPAFVISLSLAATAASMSAQNQSAVLSLPLASQRAVVSQRVGLTDITITYHRPLVKGRKIWGDVVPYDQVWRAGANENTTIEFTDPVRIEGQPLAAGLYGLHMIPNADSWIVIFSKNATSWGSFSYDKAEDALRVTVKPTEAEHQEALIYQLDPVTADSTAVVLKWERLAVAFKVSVNVPEITLASIRRQLRSTAGFTWAGYNDAALYCLENKINLEEALKWIDNSIQAEERLENFETKSELLAEIGKPAEAAAALNRGLAKATAIQLHNYGRLLLAEKKPQEASRIFQMNAQKNPETWFVYAGLARGEVAAGDYKGAAKNLKTALARAPEAQKTYVEGLLKRVEAGKDIN